jgi:chromosome segregation ATPase
MMTFFVMPGTIYSLNTPELFLTILVALAAGYSAKLLFDKYRSRSGTNETEELQHELETLQNKFSSEILRKQEAESMLQDELKAAEKRHMELQVQYAKALTHIEQLRKGDVTDADDVETDAGQQILQNLQDKIARQERSMLELEQQLRRTEQEKVNVNEAYEQLRENSSSRESLVEQFQQDKLRFEEQLQEQVSEAERLKKQFSVELSEARLQVEKLQQQVLLAKTTEREQALESEIEQLKQQLNTAEATRNINEDILVQKAGISATRIQATQVAEKVEEFRDHLTAILRDTYSYEQLLASNERLNENIARLQSEKRMAEEEIVELQKMAREKQKLEEKFESVNSLLEQKEGAWKEKSHSFESSLTLLSKQVHEKEEIIGEYIREKDELSLQIEMLQHKLDEREQLSKEMILAMKDIETRFAHFNHATVEAAIVNGNGEMQYR